MTEISALDAARVLHATGPQMLENNIDTDWQNPSLIHLAETVLNLARVPFKSAWPAQRRVLGAVQVVLKDNGFEPGAIDGLEGPQTHWAMAQFTHNQLFGERMRVLGRGRDPAPSGPSWGVQRDAEQRFGKPGGPQCTAGKVKCPYPLKLAWDTGKVINSFSCHEDVAASIERVLNNVAMAYTKAEIEAIGLDLWGGCFNHRKMRGGSALSMHSWGVAVDWDPLRNRLRWDHKRARLARTEANLWWQAWEDEGWTSLGRQRDYDWMHVQAPAL